MKLRDNGYCFVCGKNNKIGLKLNFKLSENKEILSCSFQTKREHQGFANIVHGGIISLIMDEAMVNLLWKNGYNAVSSEINIRLKRPAKVGVQLLFSASIDKKKKNLFYTKAICKDASGNTIASGSAKCIEVV